MINIVNFRIFIWTWHFVFWLAYIFKSDLKWPLQIMMRLHKIGKGSGNEIKTRIQNC